MKKSTTIRVSQETKKAVNAMKRPAKRRITADHVIQDGMAALREKEAK